MSNQTRRPAPPQRGNQAGGNRPQQSRQQQRGPSPLLKRGGAIFDQLEVEDAKAKEREERNKSGLGNVFRFWCPVGDSHEVIILDESLADGVALHEHQYEGSDGRWGNYEQCISEIAACPVCEKLGRSASYVLYLTILDLTGYENKQGEWVPQSRKLLGLKSASAHRFKKLEAAAKAKGLSLRGMRICLTRDSKDQPNIGDVGFLENGDPFYVYSEEDLIADFGHDAIKNREGKVIREANSDLEPFDYGKVFPEVDVEDLRKRWGGSTMYEQGQRSLSHDDSQGSQGGPPSRRQPPARRQEQEEHQDDGGGDTVYEDQGDQGADDGQGQDEQPSPPPRRGAPQGAGRQSPPQRQAPPPPRRQQAPQEEAPPQRGAQGGSRPRSRSPFASDKK